MAVKNAKISVLWTVLQAIANAKVKALLKYACNLNRAVLEPFVVALEKARTQPAEREAEWNLLRDKMIVENCIKDGKGNPIILDGKNYQFADSASFQATLEATKVEKFPDVHEFHVRRDAEYLELLDEEVDVPGFPHKIKWSFIELDEAGDFKGVTGEQIYVLMSNGMMDGEPPWLDDHAGQDSSAKEPRPSTKPAAAEKE